MSKKQDQKPINPDLERELEDLKKELDNFQQEKERIRSIVGKIGGVPHFHNRFFNLILIIITLICMVISILVENLSVRLLMIEIASALVSIKIIYLIHCQMKINHFKLWVLTSIEWRMNEMMKIIKKSE